MLRICIEKHPKPVIIKQAQLVTEILLGTLDLRRKRVLVKTSKFKLADVDDIENLAIDSTMAMILKMNDTAFRPIFVKLLEWGNAGLPKKDSKGRVLRLTTVYRLAGKFFETLKVCGDLLDNCLSRRMC